MTSFSDFGKQDYKNWVKVKNMVAEIESRLGNKAADDIKSLLKEIELVSEKSKKNVKETFLANESCLTAHVSEARSVRNENSLRGSACFERKIAVKGEAINYLVDRPPAEQQDSLQNSRRGLNEPPPLESPLGNRKTVASKRGSKDIMEKWVEPPVYLSSQLSNQDKNPNIV